MTAPTGWSRRFRVPDINRFPEAAPLGRAIAAKHGIPVQLLLGRLRTAHIARARFEFWATLHGTYGLALAEIGRIVGRDHTTIMSGVEKHVSGLDPRERRYLERRAA